MDKEVKVAVVRCKRRRDGVAEALGLIDSEIATGLSGNVVIKPNLVSHLRQLPSTHRDTLSVALDFTLARSPRSVTIAEGAGDARQGFKQFGYEALAHNRPVGFFDLNRDETQWDPISLADTNGERRSARISRTIVSADYRISLAQAKTHVNTMVTFSLKNMLSSIHPEDRIMMHGFAPGKPEWCGWKGAMIQFLKGDGTLVNLTTRALGHYKRIRASLAGKNREDGWKRLSQADIRFLKSLAALNANLATLTKTVYPHLSIIDGFDAMHREGPRHGTHYRLGVIVAGTNAVAVDAVAASIMGFDPREIGYLVAASAQGLGPANLDSITIVGDPIAIARKKLVPHSHHAVQRHWRKLPEILGTPKPHVTKIRTSDIAKS